MSDPTGDIGAAVEAAFSASTPEATTPDSSQPASATSTPDQQGQAAPAIDEFGPVPYTRFKEVNERAKQHASELEKFAWARGIKPEHAPELARFYQRVTSGPDPLSAYLEELNDIARTRPEATAMLRSWAARTLGTRIASQPTDAEVEPQPDIQLEDGRAVYSAGQLAKREAWIEQRMLAKFEERLKPIEDDRYLTQQERADRIVEKLKVDSREHGRQEGAALAKLPFFERLKPKIVEILQADTDFKITPKEAYHNAFMEIIVPEHAAGNAATLQRKVGASSANPSRPSGAAAPPSQDFREEFERLYGNR